jgi:hypothetical protein
MCGYFYAIEVQKAIPNIKPQSKTQKFMCMKYQTPNKITNKLEITYETYRFVLFLNI